MLPFDVRAARIVPLAIAVARLPGAFRAALGLVLVGALALLRAIVVARKRALRVLRVLGIRAALVGLSSTAAARIRILLRTRVALPGLIGLIGLAHLAGFLAGCIA